MSEVKIYLTSWCPYCNRAKALLDDLDQDYKEIDVDGNAALKAEMVKKAGGKTSVPQIFIDDQHVGGCDDLYALHAAGKLKNLLK